MSTWIFLLEKGKWKIEDTELDKNILHLNPNGWDRQAYVKGFDFEAVTFKKYINIIECMEIDENIYEGVV